jgi:hypothetical protein
VAALSAHRQEQLARWVMTGELTSESANQQLMTMHGEMMQIARRHGIAYRNDMFALAHALQQRLNRAQGAAPQRAALQEEREAMRRILARDCSR